MERWRDKKQRGKAVQEYRDTEVQRYTDRMIKSIKDPRWQRRAEVVKAETIHRDHPMARGQTDAQTPKRSATASSACTRH
jgi:hypothetical protein